MPFRYSLLSAITGLVPRCTAAGPGCLLSGVRRPRRYPAVWTVSGVGGPGRNGAPHLDGQQGTADRDQDDLPARHAADCGGMDNH